MTLYQQVFLLYFIPGIFISFLIVWHSMKLKFLYRNTLFIVSILINWIAIFLGVHMGYGAWQNMPNPPEEAFADGAKLMMSLIGGWIPGSILFALMFLIIKLFKSFSKKEIINTNP
ncbi:MAG: hypothetical protein CMJ26_00210 [Phycisphaerae bacterium]|nr:hypothetical protein [Phycisphaerae bacterium]|tara:strand:+ start:5586 stop:5933 length:348 start_codon:yes stop_codon:yes gene_type:complete